MLAFAFNFLAGIYEWAAWRLLVAAGARVFFMACMDRGGNA
jgi:hypothetical protein